MFKKMLPVAALLALLFTTGCKNVTNNSNLNPASLDDVIVTGKAFDGCNYIQWLPVKNATGYSIYRYSPTSAQQLASNMPYTDLGGMTSYEYFDVVNHDNMLENGVTYKYVIVANGVQANRGDKTTSDIDFVMDDATILGDSMGSVELTAVIPEMYSLAPAVTGVTAVYDPKLGEIRFNYTLPELYKALNFAGSNPVSLEVAHDATEIGVDNYEYFGITYTSSCPYGGTCTFAYPGNYTYKITSSWYNDGCAANYYLDNIVEGKFTVPASPEKVPTITVAAASTKLGMKITFTDVLNTATYKLWRADANTYAFKEVTAVPEKKTTINSTSNLPNTEYTYYDADVEFGKTYVYALTGTYNDAALVYQDNCVQDVTFDSAISLTPQFAAFNNDGKVSLSWNAEDGYTYKVLRSENYTDATKGSYKEQYVDLTGAVTVNGVTYATDTISKLADTGSYTYSLIANGEGITGSYVVATDTVTYNETILGFTSLTAAGIDTNANGAFDKIKVTAVTDDGFDMTGVKIYRATAKSDNVTTSAGTNYEFTSAYKEVTLTPVAAETEDTTYVYTDDSLTEEDIAMNIYVYAIKNNDQSKVALYTASTTAITAATIPTIRVAQISSATAKYSISWNALYEDENLETNTYIDPATPITVAPQAMKVSIYQCYSNEAVIDNVTEWGTPKVITDNADAFKNDSWYLETFELKGETKNTANEYYWVRIDFENANGTYTYSKSINNPAYEAPKVSKINSLYTGTIYTNVSDPTAYKTCLVMSTINTTSLNVDNFEVWLTPVTSDGFIYDKATKVTGLEQAKIVRAITGDDTSADLNGTDPDNKKFYLLNETWSTNTDVSDIIVHVYDKSTGESYREILSKW